MHAFIAVIALTRESESLTFKPNHIRAVRSLAAERTSVIMLEYDQLASRAVDQHSD